MFKRYAAGFGLTLALGWIPFAALAQTPAPGMQSMPSMDMSTMDCSTAKSHMAAMMTPTSDAMMSVNSADDLDKTYAAAMKAMVNQAMMMSKIEMKCGKNAKAMAVAKKMDSQLQDDSLTVHALQPDSEGTVARRLKGKRRAMRIVPPRTTFWGLICKLFLPF